MENTASKIKVVEMSGGYILPKVTETKGRKKHVEMGIEGADDFFTTLIKRYETSPTNQACIDGSTDLIYGKGVKARTPELEDYLYKLTNQDEIRKIVFDYKMFGNAAIQCVFNEDRSQIIGFYHLPVDTLRAAKVDEQGNIPGYYYSSDWSDIKIKPTYIPNFNQDEWENDVQVIYIKRYSPGKFYYGIPDYYSAIQYAAVEEEISNLHINNILNNFMPSTILNFNSGLPPVEEQYLIENSIKAKFTGTTNAGRFILSFNENPESKTTVEMLRPENLHQQYDFIAEESSRKIMLAHRVTSQMLFGIKTASGFSSNADELKVGYEIFYSMVINPVQGELIKVFQGIMEFNDVEGEELYFSPLIPFGILEDLVNSVGAQDAKSIIEGTGQDNVSTEAVNVIDGINSLSPLVANKVLESMTPGEIRSLVGLNSQDESKLDANGNALPTHQDLPDTQEVTPEVSEGVGQTVGSPDEVVGYVDGPENVGASLAAEGVNENLKNLTGRQYQQLLRIVNQYQKQKINEAQAVLMLISAFGFSDGQAKTMLGIDTANQTEMSRYNDVDWNSWKLEANYEINN